MFPLSPKVYVPLILAILAAIALMLLTGDDTYLVGILVALVAAGGGIIVPPATGPTKVTQAEVEALAQGRAPPNP